MALAGISGRTERLVTAFSCASDIGSAVLDRELWYQALNTSLANINGMLEESHLAMLTGVCSLLHIFAMCSRIFGQGGPIAPRNLGVEIEAGKRSLDVQKAELWFWRLSCIHLDRGGAFSFSSIDLNRISTRFLTCVDPHG